VLLLVLFIIYHSVGNRTILFKGVICIVIFRHCAMYKSGMNSHQGRSAGYDDEDRAKPEIRNLTTRSML